MESIGLIELGHPAFLLILGFSRANQFQSPSVRIGTYSLHGEIKIGLLVLIWAMVTLLIRSFVYTYQPLYNRDCHLEGNETGIPKVL